MHIFYRKTAILLLLLASTTMYSQETLTKTIERTFNMSSTGELHIDNKYGNITLTGWDKKNVSVTIDIKVTHKKKDNAKALLDRIEANIKSTNNYVSITSEISDKNVGFLSRYINKVNPFEFDKGNLDIHYIVYLPTHTDIDVTNKFGDVVIDNWTGKLKANIEHGDLWTNTEITNANIDMKFGKLKSKAITYGSIHLKNGTIDLEASKNLILTTSGANIEIDTVEHLDINSSKDDIFIQQVEDIKGQLEFSNARINMVQDKILISMNVSELKVLNIINPAPFVDIDQQSSEIHINIANLSFKFNAVLEQGLLRLPKTFSNIKTEMINEGKRIREINATYGKSTVGMFSFKGKKGVILLEEQ